MSETSQRWRNGVALGLLAGCLWLLVWKLTKPTLDQVLNWDEVDYVQAARLGLSANRLEWGSMPAEDYLRVGSSRWRGEQPIWPDNYDETRDPLLLRHYHPPLPILLLALLPEASPERVYRTSHLFGALLLTIVLLLAYTSITEQPTFAGLLLISTASVWMNLMLFRSISFHGWLACWLTACAALTSGWLRTGNPRWGIGLGLALAAAFLTLETALLVGLGVLASLWLWGAASATGTPVCSWKRIGLGLIFVVLVVTAVWPGFLTHLYLGKVAGLYGYRLVRGEEYGHLDNTRGLLLLALLPMLTIAASTPWLFAFNDDRRRWGPLFLIGGSYAFLLFWVAISPTYVVPAMGPLACMAAYAVDRSSSWPARTGFVMMALTTFVVTWPFWLPIHTSDHERQDLSRLAVILRGREALIDGAHIYRYYLGDTYPIQAISVSADERNLLRRVQGVYRPLTPSDVEGKIVVLQRRRSFQTEYRPDLHLRPISQTGLQSLTVFVSMEPPP